ncbi:hypothetical protein BHU72_01315 [Desulfuribacillus stibiiarsenatis]|uniref:DUF3243 domain-containing protein n=1 Tax=Desulfuribacillus stibiiarsenatis TaxID=1390249 RepID=A0A1E5LA21_9FIRM|nr:DUF3243 domain-containing protein [Desulfuribacillus stibiiarsenatis]OEH86928.1 hypothetical protein BHU72_01315 [Desulfuribacillus stibiiarsenatis]
MSVLDNFDEWKGYLAKRISQAESMGMSQDSIALAATKVGDFLAESVEPQNREEQLLKEMWVNSNEQEQQAIANALVKMLDNNR